jgi:hypothetical protein
MSRKHNPANRVPHHRKNRAAGGTDDVRNISTVSVKQHRAFHALFGDSESVEIMRALNTIWIDPDYEFVLRRKVPYIGSVIHNW